MSIHCFACAEWYLYWAHVVWLMETPACHIHFSIQSILCDGLNASDRSSPFLLILTCAYIVVAAVIVVVAFRNKYIIFFYCLILYVDRGISQCKAICLDDDANDMFVHIISIAVQAESRLTVIIAKLRLALQIPLKRNITRFFIFSLSFNFKWAEAILNYQITYTTQMCWYFYFFLPHRWSISILTISRCIYVPT